MITNTMVILDEILMKKNGEIQVQLKKFISNVIVLMVVY